MNTSTHNTSNHSQIIKAQVLIVGAGPVGL